MKIVVAALLTALLLSPFSVHAEPVPERGISKTDVHRQYGEPEARRAAVGQPPISRWSYPGFTVYFENDLVLHSVRDERPRPPAPAGDEAGNDAEAGGRDEQAVIREPNRSESDTPPASTTAPAHDDPDAARDAASADDSTEGRTDRFRFDPASGRIVIDGDAGTDAERATDSY